MKKDVDVVLPVHSSCMHFNLSQVYEFSFVNTCQISFCIQTNDLFSLFVLYFLIRKEIPLELC